MPPVLAAAKAIIDRGHDVTILSQPSVEDRATALGCVAFSETGVYRRDVALEEQLDRTLPVLVGPSIGADLIAAADKTAADALVVDPNLSGALAAAETLEQPSAVLLHSLFKTFVDVWFGELWALLAEPINTTRQSFGADAARTWAEMLVRHDLIVSPVPPVFDAPVDDVPPALHHVGFLVPSGHPHTPFDVPPGDDPLVAVSFSTTYQHQDELIAATVAALADEPVRVIVTTSGYGRAIDRPANAVVTHFLPHAQLFEDTEVVITHGGLGTTAAALHYGLPLLCVPMGRDQPLNATRVTALGAGLTLTTESGPEALRDAVRDIVLDPSYRTKAGEIASASRDAGEAGAAARAIESLLT